MPPVQSAQGYHRRVPLVVIGASHHTIGLDELAALTPLGVPARARLADHPAVAGVLVLATCNRFEVYLDAIEFHPAVEAVNIGRMLTPFRR